MEWKIGEIKQINNEWYQCIEAIGCASCDLYDNEKCPEVIDERGACVATSRSDKTPVIFKKLEKVGEPYMYYFPSGRIMCFQRYKLFNKLYSHNTEYVMCDFNEEGIVNIEVKQNKEDMDNQNIIEYNGKKYKFVPCNERTGCTELCAFKNLSFGECLNIPCNSTDRKDKRGGYFTELPLEETINKTTNMEKNKLKLNPFDLEAAKAGKPIYTRDGRKARIVCFDAKRKDEKSIIALIPSKDYPGFEDLIAYPNNGNYHEGHENDGDLMMLSEKKEGWVNIYKGGLLDTKSYPTKKEAFDKASSRDYVCTVKIEWEE